MSIRWDHVAAMGFLGALACGGEGAGQGPTAGSGDGGDPVGMDPKPGSPGTAPTPPPAYASYEEAKSALDAKAIVGPRTRPSSPYWCTKDAFYWTDVTSGSLTSAALHAWNVGTQTELVYSFNAGGSPSVAGTDAFIAVQPPGGAKLNLYRASESLGLVESFDRTSGYFPLGIYTVDGAVILASQESYEWVVRRWDMSTKTTTLLESRPGYTNMGPIFDAGRILLSNRSERIVIDVTRQPPESTSLEIEAGGTLERPSALGLLVSGRNSGELTLYAQNKNTPETRRDLGAEIAAVPPLYTDPQSRNLHGFVSVLGTYANYLVYQGQSGIFAYDVVKKVLYPVQPGHGAFGAFGCVTNESGTLVFPESTPSEIRIRAVRLAGILP